MTPPPAARMTRRTEIIPPTFKREVDANGNVFPILDKPAGAGSVIFIPQPPLRDNIKAELDCGSGESDEDKDDVCITNDDDNSDESESGSGIMTIEVCSEYEDSNHGLDLGDNEFDHEHNSGSDSTPPSSPPPVPGLLAKRFHVPMKFEILIRTIRLKRSIDVEELDPHSPELGPVEEASLQAPSESSPLPPARRRPRSPRPRRESPVPARRKRAREEAHGVEPISAEHIASLIANSLEGVFEGIQRKQEEHEQRMHLEFEEVKRQGIDNRRRIAANDKEIAELRRERLARIATCRDPNSLPPSPPPSAPTSVSCSATAQHPTQRPAQQAAASIPVYRPRRSDLGPDQARVESQLQRDPRRVRRHRMNDHLNLRHQCRLSNFDIPRQPEYQDEFSESTEALLKADTQKLANTFYLHFPGDDALMRNDLGCWCVKSQIPWTIHIGGYAYKLPRMAARVFLQAGSLLRFLSSKNEVYRRCHTERCVNPAHLVIEDRRERGIRDRCFRDGVCRGGHEGLECII